jgi:hypothetical protein
MVHLDLAVPSAAILSNPNDFHCFSWASRPSPPVAEDGALYVLQISSAGGPPPQGGTGSLYRVPPGGGAPQTIVAPGAGLVAPGGIAIDRDGSIYVTNFSVSPTLGTVVKVVP